MGCVHGTLPVRLRRAQFAGDKVRDGDGADGLAWIADAAGDLEPTLGYLFAVAVKVEAEAEGLLALLFEVYMDVEDVLKGDGAEVLAFGGEAGPANDVAVAFAVDAQAQAAPEGVLGGFHEDEEARKVDDAGLIGVGPLDAAAGAEFDGHVSCRGGRMLLGSRP